MTSSTDIGKQLEDMRRTVDTAHSRLTVELTRLRDEVSEQHSSMFRTIEGFFQLHRAANGQRPLPQLAPPTGGWAISVELARLLSEHVSSRNPSLVVELGSGASTVLLGLLAETNLGMRIVSLEHDPLWFADTKLKLRASGISDLIDLRYAPLTEVEAGGRTMLWYDPESISDLNGIEMIIVDGPPAATGPQARYLAGPILAPLTSEHCLWVVDDTIRDDERELVEMWVDELGLNPLASYVWGRKGATILETSGGSHDV